MPHETSPLFNIEALPDLLCLGPQSVNNRPPVYALGRCNLNFMPQQAEHALNRVRKLAVLEPIGLWRESLVRLGKQAMTRCDMHCSLGLFGLETHEQVQSRESRTENE